MVVGGGVPLLNNESGCHHSTPDGSFTLSGDVDILNDQHRM